MTIYQAVTSFADAVLPPIFAGRLRSAVRRRRDGRNFEERQRRIAHWESHKGSPNSMTIEVQPGVQLSLFYDSDLCRLIYMGGYEHSERSFLNAFLRKGDLFIDVGANIGLYSVTAAAIVGDAGRVHSFEPCSGTVQRLDRNLQVNSLKNVTIHSIALSDKAGELDMAVSLDGFDAWNSLSLESAGDHTAVEKVKTDKWDDVYDSVCEGKSVAMMKVDIEGWESRFLEGAKEFLSDRNAPVLQLEFNDEAAKAAGSSGREVYKFLERVGYRMFTYDPATGLRPEPIRESYAYLNIFATKNPENVRSRLGEGFRGRIY